MVMNGVLGVQRRAAAAAMGAAPPHPPAQQLASSQCPQVAAMQPASLLSGAHSPAQAASERCASSGSGVASAARSIYSQCRSRWDRCPTHSCPCRGLVSLHCCLVGCQGNRLYCAACEPSAARACACRFWMRQPAHVGCAWSMEQASASCCTVQLSRSSCCSAV